MEMDLLSITTRKEGRDINYAWKELCGTANKLLQCISEERITEELSDIHCEMPVFSILNWRPGFDLKPLQHLLKTHLESNQLVEEFNEWCGTLIEKKDIKCPIEFNVAANGIHYKHYLIYGESNDRAYIKILLFNLRQRTDTDQPQLTVTCIILTLPLDTKPPIFYQSGELHRLYSPHEHIRVDQFNGEILEDVQD